MRGRAFSAAEVLAKARARGLIIILIVRLPDGSNSTDWTRLRVPVIGRLEQVSVTARLPSIEYMPSDLPANLSSQRLHGFSFAKTMRATITINNYNNNFEVDLIYTHMELVLFSATNRAHTQSPRQASELKFCSNLVTNNMR